MLANPWIILGALVGLAGITGGAYIKGRQDGVANIVARQARDDQVRMDTLQLAQLAAAEEIAKISVTHTTIRQKAEVTIREKPVYRDCVNDPGVVGLLDAARENRSPAEPAGGGKLPAIGASPASVLW